MAGARGRWLVGLVGEALGSQRAGDEGLGGAGEGVQG